MCGVATSKGKFLHLVCVWRLFVISEPFSEDIGGINGSIGRLIESTKGSIERLTEATNRLALNIHVMKESMPQVVVGVSITPSEASHKKDADFKVLLDDLGIDAPTPTAEKVRDMGICEDFSTFCWHWQNRDEAASYNPLCTYLNSFQRDGKSVTSSPTVSAWRIIYCLIMISFL